MKILILLISFAISVTVKAQQICGVILDTKGKPLAGASLSLKGSYDGATADSTGRFCFSSSATGPQYLVATLTGYKTVESAISMLDPSYSTITMKEDITEMKAVTISAGSFEASDKKKTTVFTSTDVLTTSTNADITAAIKTLPGTQQVGEREGLFVRGGHANETKTYMDGVLVNNFFYSGAPGIAQRARFNPMLFKGTVFSAGGYSALYGQGISSALILESVDMPEASSGMVGLCLVGASAGYQSINKKENFSWGANYTYMNMGLEYKLIPQRQEYFRVPVYHNGEINFRLKTSKTGIIKYFGYASKGVLGMHVIDIDSTNYRNAFNLDNFNTYHNLSYREKFNNGWAINAGLSFTNNRDSINSYLEDMHNNVVLPPLSTGKNYNYVANTIHWNSKVVIEKRLGGLNTFRFGNENNLNSYRLVYKTQAVAPVDQKISDNITAFFAETDFYFTNRIAVKIGSRYEYSSAISRSAVSPRLSVAYKLSGKSQVSVAYGNFYQTPESKHLFQALILDYLKATHYISQFQRVASGQTFRAEVFYKKYSNLVRVNYNSGKENLSSTGNGYAKGFEFFWRDKKSIKGFDYWISYSFLDTKRLGLNYPTALQPDFTARHTTSVVLKRLFPFLKTQINLSYSFASGRPYYNIKADSGAGEYQILDRGKTIDYHNLGFSVNYLPKLTSKGPGKYTVLVLSVSNVLGNKQVFGYQYSQNNQRKIAVIPPAKTFIFLAIYLSIGTDKREDIINNL